MTCMTTKKKFDVVDPDVIVLRNGRYAYRCECPWPGKNGKRLTAFKFCSSEAHQKYQDRQGTKEMAEESTEEVQEAAECEHTDDNESDAETQ
jgi:hypothetical protein